AANPLRVSARRRQQRHSHTHYSEGRRPGSDEERSGARPRHARQGRSMRRRAFLAMPAILTAAPSTDARIDELTIGFQDYRYRAPYKFGGKEVDRVTMLNVRCRLSTRGGKSAEGGASMSMGNVWSFPAPGLDYDVTLGAMKSLAEKIVRITRRYTAYAHPLDVNYALEPEYLKAAVEVTRELKLPLPVP